MRSAPQRRSRRNFHPKTAPLVVVTWGLLAFVCASPAKDFSLPAAGSTNAPLLLAFYHPWYGTPWGPSGQWRKWDSFAFPQRYQPARLIEGWRHDIASADYPLLGPYDVSDPEVVRWHFRLAKAAGIDGFICSWWKLGRPDSFWDWQYQLFERVWLPVAAQEDFAIAVLDECAHYAANERELLSRIVTFLPGYARHRGYLHINRQPAWFIYQVWDDWLKPEAAARYIATAEERVGPVFWILDKMRARGLSEYPGANLYVADDWLKLGSIDCFGSYSLFGNWRETNGPALNRLYSGVSRAIHAAGKAVQLPVLPGHDNTAVNDKPYIVPRVDGSTLRTFLSAAAQARPEIITVCSFNEWFEMTQVEPAANWPDPYLYLRVIADYRGKTWQTPPLPPAASFAPTSRKRFSRPTGRP